MSSWFWLNPDLHAGYRRDEEAKIIPKSLILLSRSFSCLLHFFWDGSLFVSTIAYSITEGVSFLNTPSYCGQYVASPSLASAGGTLEKIAYGISVPGFIMTSTLWVHLAAKFVTAPAHH